MNGDFATCEENEETCLCLAIQDDEPVFEECDSRFDCSLLREQCVFVGLLSICVSNGVAATNFFQRAPIDPNVPEREFNPTLGRERINCRKYEHCVGDLYCAQYVDDAGLPILPSDLSGPPGPKNLKECNLDPEFREEAKHCFCYGTNFKKMTRDCRETGCIEGAVCAHDEEFNKTQCVSAAVEAAFFQFKAVPLNPGVVPPSDPPPAPKSPSPTPSPSPIPETRGDTTPLVSPQVRPTPSPSAIAVLPSSPSAMSSPIPESLSASPDSSGDEQQPTEEGVCIDVALLENVDRQALVFEDHQWALVLCDKQGSCATKGHMVEYKGKGMMMRSYCAQVGCEQKKTWVNSPKYSIGKRVKTKTEDLEFAALAARWGTTFEERGLKTAMRLGF